MRTAYTRSHYVSLINSNLSTPILIPPSIVVGVGLSLAMDGSGTGVGQLQVSRIASAAYTVNADGSQGSENGVMIVVSTLLNQSSGNSAMYFTFPTPWVVERYIYVHCGTTSAGTAYFAANNFLVSL